MTTHVLAKAANGGPISGRPASGVLFLHAVPRAIASHLEWGLARALGTQVAIDWAEQPVAVRQLRAEIVWEGPAGTAARIASTLRAFTEIRYEVTEDPSPGREGERFAVTPTLGLFRGTIGVHGDVMVPEERLRTALTRSDLAEQVRRLIGSPWDDELEPFRCAHEGSTVRVLHDVV